MKFFDIDSPLMLILTKIADLMILNLMTLILCIPIVTGGAAITALQYVVLKMARGEDYRPIKDYFKSFKTNFKQATIIWIFFVLIALVIGADLYIFSNFQGIPFVKIFIVVITIVGVIALFTFTFVFPVLAKFDNTIRGTLKNALLISIMQFPVTLIMLIMYNLFLIMSYVSPPLLIKILPLFLVFGLSAPAYGGAFLYSNFFLKIEKGIKEKHMEEHPEEYDLEGNYIGPDGVNSVDEDEKIFHDKLDESIQVEEKHFH